MCRVIDPGTRLLGFDLTSQIDTYPIELRDHCLYLVRPQEALIEFKFFNAAQTFNLVRFHRRPPKIVSLRSIHKLPTSSDAKFGPMQMKKTASRAVSPNGSAMSGVASNG